jgi:plasmid maintenance system antidote protein VapI
MTDGEILKNFIDNQHKSKVSIAEDLGVSKQSLFAYFKSRDLTPEIKKRFEKYFGKVIFTGQDISMQGSVQSKTSVKALNQVDIDYKMHLKGPYTESLKAQIKQIEENNQLLKEKVTSLDDKIKELQNENERLQNEVIANLKHNEALLKAVTAQVKAASMLAVQRSAGKDQKKLLEERRTLDKLIGEFLQKP